MKREDKIVSKTGKSSKWTVKDIVFLAIISAVAACTAAVMAVVSQIYIYGVAQLATAFQFSLFPAIALMKVRKQGSLLFFSVFTGVIELFMAPVMFFSSVIVGVVLELIVFALFHGFKRDAAVFIASWLFIPCSLPLNLLYYRMFSKEYLDLFFSSGLQIVSIVCVIASIALAAVGAALGIKISRELIKAGVMKN